MSFTTLAAVLSLLGPLAPQEVPSPGRGTLPATGVDAEAIYGRLTDRSGTLGSVDPSTYRLGPGDWLVAYVWGRISLTLPLEVGPDGRVFIPQVGSMRVRGVPLSEVQRRIVQELLSQYRDVRVEVRLERMREYRVYITGEVRTPGVALASGSSRLADLLPDSLFTPRSSRRSLSVIHRDGRREPYDLLRFQRTGYGGPEPALEDGDVLLVPVAARMAGLWGGVAWPDAYEVADGDSLHTLLELGGGPLPSAFMDQAWLVRRRNGDGLDSLRVSLVQVLDRTADLPLRDGDQLFIAFDPTQAERHRVTVAGMVVRAGDYPIDPGATRLSHVIRAAGGFRPDADLSAIRLLRPSPDIPGRRVEFERLAGLGRGQMTESEYESFRMQLAARNPDFRIEWARLVSGGPTQDPLLIPGDIVRVDRVQNTVRVEGQVIRPGVFQYDPDANWRHYVRLAGGFANRGARTRVLVTRIANGQTVAAGDVERLAPGDLIWVPERPDVTLWDHLRELIVVAGGVATIIIAVKSL